MQQDSREFVFVIYPRRYYREVLGQITQVDSFLFEEV
jgi:hypothetical protein